jgi:hypothetical protein
MTTLPNNATVTFLYLSTMSPGEFIWNGPFPGYDNPSMNRGFDSPVSNRQQPVGWLSKSDNDYAMHMANHFHSQIIFYFSNLHISGR